MIDRPGVPSRVSLAQEHQAAWLDPDADLFQYFAACGFSKILIRIFCAAAGKDECAGKISEMSGPPAEIDLDAAIRVSDKCNRSRSPWRAILMHVLFFHRNRTPIPE